MNYIDYVMQPIYNIYIYILMNSNGFPLLWIYNGSLVGTEVVHHVPNEIVRSITVIMVLKYQVHCLI